MKSDNLLTPWYRIEYTSATVILLYRSTKEKKKQELFVEFLKNRNLLTMSHSDGLQAGACSSCVYNENKTVHEVEVLS
jgi:hypothetical protein